MSSLTEEKQTSLFSSRNVPFWIVYLFGAESTKINPFQKNVAIFTIKINVKINVFAENLCDSWEIENTIEKAREARIRECWWGEESKFTYAIKGWHTEVYSGSSKLHMVGYKMNRNLDYEDKKCLMSV
jgi:hypothetical protein